MILRPRIIVSDSVDPTRNLALEEYLTENVKEDELILFLWQNEKTVVIGKNQNYWAEVNTEQANADGVTVVRRLSGGGAVFHDLGNLNFTFVTRREHYDVDRQLGVIIEALRMLGIEAQRTGRNDIESEGRKFSGNAFYKSELGWYHHGTLMVDVDKSKLGAYLNVSKAKLESKGVKSVRSRVRNLKEKRSDLTVEMLLEALCDAFARGYGDENVSYITHDEIDWDSVEQKRHRYESWEWTCGRKIPFTIEMERRFNWGIIQLKLEVQNGYIKGIQCFSDAMDQDIASKVEASLLGTRYIEGEEFWLNLDEMVKTYDL